MTPEEAINAATINGAAAMEISQILGSLSKGKIANLIITKKIPSLAYLPYKFGESQIEKVMINEKQLITKEELLTALKKNKPEVLITLGAGDIDQLVQPITQVLSVKS